MEKSVVALGAAVWKQHTEDTTTPPPHPCPTSPSVWRLCAGHHLVGQVQHSQVRLYFEAERGEAGHAVLWPGELMEDDGVFGIQLLLLPASRDRVETSIHRIKAGGLQCFSSYINRT